MNEETQNKTSTETFKMKDPSRAKTNVLPNQQSDQELISPTTLINEIHSDRSKNTREWTAEKQNVIELKEVKAPGESEEIATQ